MAPRLATLLCALACTSRAMALSAARGASSASAARAPVLLSAARADAAKSGVCQVSSGADAGAGSLRAALADPSCTSIVIAPGTVIVLQSELDVTNNVTVSCSPVVVATTPISSDIWSSISGSGGGGGGGACILDGAGVTRIIFVGSPALGLRLTLRGLTFRNGAALGLGGLNGFGGAIYFRPAGGVLTVEACQFMNNRADAVGGAIRVRPIATQLGEGITFVLRDSQFNVNTAGFLGGAIAVGLRSNNEMSGSVFISNSVTEAATEFTSGGAVSIFGAQAVSKNNKFERNVAGTAGGAVDIFALCPGDFFDAPEEQQAARVELVNNVLLRNQVGFNAAPVDVVFGGGVDISGCTYATPLADTPLPRSSLIIGESSFTENAAVSESAFGGAVGSAWGSDILVVASSFRNNADTCSADGAFYLNVFSSDGTGCSDTLAVQAEGLPTCDAWTPLGLVHTEAGSLADGTEQTCVPLQPAKGAAFCCAPSVEAPAVVCPIAPVLATQPTCPHGTQPREQAKAALMAADAMLIKLKALKMMGFDMN